MSITHRSANAKLIPGYHHSGDRGLGLLGSSVPGAGAHGPGIAFPSLLLADMGKEVMVQILTVPAALTLFVVDEAGRVTAEGPPGTHVGSFQLWLDGVDAGISTYTVGIGPAGLLTGTNVSANPFNFGGLSGPMPPSGALSGANISAAPRNTGALIGVLPAAGVLSGNNFAANPKNTGSLSGPQPPSGMLSGSNLAASPINSGNLVGVLPPSGWLSGTNAAANPINSGNLVGVLPPSGWLSGTNAAASPINTGNLVGLLPPSGWLSGNNTAANPRNTGRLNGWVVAARAQGARAVYGSMGEYLQRFGMVEATQLLSDEEDVLTQPLLQAALVGQYVGDTSADGIAAGEAAYSRFRRALERSSDFVDGYLRSALTLPLEATNPNAGLLADCTLCLARYDLAEDCDNVTERMKDDRELWLKWLREVANGKVQLASADGLGNVSAGGRTQHGRTGSRWDRVGCGGGNRSGRWQ